MSPNTLHTSDWSGMCFIYMYIYINITPGTLSKFLTQLYHNCNMTVKREIVYMWKFKNVFFSYALHSTCGDIRERKNHGVPIHFVSDTSGKHLNYNITKALSTARSQFSITQTFTLKLVCLIKITNILQ